MAGHKTDTNSAEFGGPSPLARRAEGPGERRRRDPLTRLLAVAASRRQVLEAVLAGAAGGMLALRGIGARAQLPDGRTWDETTSSTAFDPSNRRGRSEADRQLSEALPRDAFGVRRDALEEATAAGSGSFTLTIPLVRLPGRGLDLALDLTYNSRLWHKAGNRMVFDIDHGWPAPGWSLGFGKLVSVGWRFAEDHSLVEESMLIEADGTRHPYAVVAKYYGGDYEVPADYEVGPGPRPPWRDKFVARTTDGTFIDYSLVMVRKYGPSNPATQSSAATFESAIARYPNGTVVEYTAPGWGDEAAIYPTRITDANGNSIAITYLDNIGPMIDTIMDTLGRTVRFEYAGGEVTPRGEGPPTAIIGPGLNGGTRTFVRLQYTRSGLDYAFAPNIEAEVPSRLDPPNLRIVEAIYDSGTATGYWFREPGSWSGYGMLAKITEQRAMGFVPPRSSGRTGDDHAGGRDAAADLQLPAVPGSDPH